MTRPYAEVIGDPIAHSKSPLIHNFWLAKLGIDAEYRACHVRPDELADYFTRRRGDEEWRGCNVTIPHKIATLLHLDEVDNSVENVGACNCVTNEAGALRGSNTDTAGVDWAIAEIHDSVCIIGAGGAARATIPSLDVFCAFDIRIVARDPEKARNAFSHLDYDFQFYSFDEVGDAMRGAQGVINATPLGMIGQPAMPAKVLDAIGLTDPRAYVFDMVYVPLQTELLLAGQRCGRRTVDGLWMLIGQASISFRHFFGVLPPYQRDAKLRALLTQ